MLELSNSRKVFLGRAPDGRDRWALDCSLGALQMRGVDEPWQDIKPALVKTAQGWQVDGAPYALEFSADGGRRIFPDRQDRNKYLHLPAVAFFKDLPKRIEGNRIIASAPKFDVILQFTNTGVQFMVLIKEPLPFDRITLDVDSIGLDILQLLKATAGLGIPRPRLIEQGVDPMGAQERWLDWSLKAGQLELGFDLTGLRFPILLKNTTLDLQVGASADDAHSASDGANNTTTGSLYLGEDSNYYYDTGLRFSSVTISIGATITTAYLTVEISYNEGDASLNDLYGEDSATPANFTSGVISGRTRTAASIALDDPFGTASSGWYNLPEMKTVVQELVDSYDYSGGLAMAFLTIADHSSSHTQTYHSRDWGAASAPKLHIEYTAGGGGADQNGFFNML